MPKGMFPSTQWLPVLEPSITLLCSVSIFTSVGFSVFFYYSCEILKYLLIYYTFVDFKSSTCHVLLQVFSSQTCHFTPSEYVLFLLQETRINARKKQLYPLHTICRSQLGDSQDCFYLVKNQKKTRHAMYVQGKAEALSRNQFCRSKALRSTYSVCQPVVLVIQHAKRMRHIMLSSVACQALPYSST